MQPTSHNTRRLRRRAWLQHQAFLVLQEKIELTGKEILANIRDRNASPTSRGWCEASAVSFGMMMRELVASGLVIRSKLSSGTYSYSLPDDLDVELFNEYFTIRGLHPPRS